ncbi:MAG: putative transporter [Fibrobacteraceae bacterium]
MQWLVDLFSVSSAGQQIVALALTATFGLMIGKIKVRGIALGSAGALFVGIALGHFGLRIDPGVLHFAQEFGLILFVYTIGMQVGPGFIDSIRRHGLVLNVLSVSVIALGVGVTLVLYFFTRMHDRVPELIGMLCGAVTNTPSLGAAQQAFVSRGITPEAAQLPGIGYAVAYPFGVIGIILVMILLRLFYKKPEQEAEEYAASIAQGKVEFASCSVRVENKNLAGVMISKIPGLATSGVVITRFMRAGKVSMPHESNILAEGDVLHLVGLPQAVDSLIVTIGSRTEKNLTELASNLVSKTILVTNKKILGKTIKSLGLVERYGVTISRVNRGEFKFTGRPNLRIHFADKLLAVGPEDSIEIVAKELGNSLKALDRPEILPAFLGIFLGVVFGSIPIAVPGMPVPLKLGLAGGPLIISIILARIRRIGQLNFFMAASANLMLRELGITLFLTCVGLNAGIRFVYVLVNGDGLFYMGLAAFITFIPIFVVGLVGRFVFKVNYLSLCGAIAGSMTDPPALAFANAIVPSDASNVAYASVYPLTMLLRIFSGQVLAIVLFTAAVV